jgi:serine/threonine protein phosphatase PrpC
LQSELGEPELEVLADRLIELALQRGAPDNVSFVVVRVR